MKIKKNQVVKEYDPVDAVLWTGNNIEDVFNNFPNYYISSEVIAISPNVDIIKCAKHGGLGIELIVRNGEYIADIEGSLIIVTPQELTALYTII